MHRISRSLRRQAFTLIELLVVVAIIALLISILLPSLGRARQQARIVKCSAHLHDIGISLMTYNNDFNRLPQQNTFGSTNRRDERHGPGFWGLSVHESLAERMGGLSLNADRTEATRTNPVFYCPYAPPEKMDTMADLLSGPGTGNPIESTEEIYLHISYVYAGRLDECVNDPRKWDTVGPDVDQILEQEILQKRERYMGSPVRVSESEKVLMADTVAMWFGGGMWRINHGAGWDTPLASTSNPKLFTSNILYGDGHVSQVKPDHYQEMFIGATINQSKRNASVGSGGAINDSIYMPFDVIFW